MKVLSICGSPRRGNSEALLRHLNAIFEKKGIENEVILLRQQVVVPCRGCVEFCNKNLKCVDKDDMVELMRKMQDADAYVIASPTYFSMPPGLLKDFMDKCSIFYTAKADLSKKKGIALVAGTDESSMKKNLANVAGFLDTLGVKVVAKAAFKSHSELNGDYDDIFKLNPGLEEELNTIAGKLVKK